MLTLVLQDDGSTEIDIDRRAVPSGFLYVDGIVGDVGHGVLLDRRVLAEEGMVVVVVTVCLQFLLTTLSGAALFGGAAVGARGF